MSKPTKNSSPELAQKTVRPIADNKFVLYVSDNKTSNIVVVTHEKLRLLVEHGMEYL